MAEQRSHTNNGSVVKPDGAGAHRTDGNDIGNGGSIPSPTFRSNSDSAQWSQEYCGLQHLKGLRTGFQVTVTHRDDWSECSVFMPGCGFSDDSSAHNSAEAARSFGEERATALNAYEAEKVAA